MNADHIRNIEMRTSDNWGKTKAYATITFSNGMKISGFRVLEGPKGLFAGGPSIQKKDKETGEMKWEKFIFFDEKEDYQAFQKLVVEKYHQVREGADSGGSYQDYNKPNSSSNSSGEKEWWAD
jgi:DNA-binding cell septation regulator SpoVG